MFISLYIKCHPPVVDLAILILVCEVEHGVYVLLADGDREVPHHQLEICLREKLLLDFVFLGTEVLGVRVRPADDLR